MKFDTPESYWRQAYNDLFALNEFPNLFTILPLHRNILETELLEMTKSFPYPHIILLVCSQYHGKLYLKYGMGSGCLLYIDEYHYSLELEREYLPDIEKIVFLIKTLYQIKHIGDDSSTRVKTWDNLPSGAKILFDQISIIIQSYYPGEEDYYHSVEESVDLPSIATNIVYVDSWPNDSNWKHRMVDKALVNILFILLREIPEVRQKLKQIIFAMAGFFDYDKAIDFKADY